MSEYKIKQSIAYTDNQDGTPACGDCGIQIGERADTCTNCALYEREGRNEALKQENEALREGLIPLFLNALLARGFYLTNEIRQWLEKDWKEITNTLLGESDD